MSQKLYQWIYIKKNDIICMNYNLYFVDQINVQSVFLNYMRAF